MECLEEMLRANMRQIARPRYMVQDGDKITIDAESRELKLGISKAELKRRTASWKKPKPNYTTGVLAKYAHLTTGLASSTHNGIITVNSDECNTVSTYLSDCPRDCSRYIEEL
mgnify:CR=1 FL=1